MYFKRVFLKHNGKLYYFKCNEQVKIIFGHIIYPDNIYRE